MSVELKGWLELPFATNNTKSLVARISYFSLQDGRCSMADACSNPGDAQGVYLMIMQNFQRHFNTNRAPFGLYYHPAWFTTPHHREGFELFLDTIAEMEDVWLVTSWQAIQWMRSAQAVQLSFLKRKYFQKSHNSGQDPRLQTLRM